MADFSHQLYAWGVFLGAFFVILATTLPFIRRGYWWLRVFDFPRLQIAALGATVLALGLLTLPLNPFSLAVFLALFLSIAVQVYRIYPYTPLAATEVVSARDVRSNSRLRIFVANVLMANRQSEKLLKVLKVVDPDLIFLVETDEWWADALSQYTRPYPFRIEQPQSNTYGMLLYSRFALENPVCRYLVESDVPSFHAIIRLPSGDSVQVYALHPRPPYPQQDTFERDAELLIVGREVRKSGMPAIVIGDLNDVAWSSTTRLFQRTSGLLDPRVGRGVFATYHANIPLLRWPLDHVFVSSSFRLVAMRKLSRFGSDHFPIFAELMFNPDAANKNTAPQPAAGDSIELQQKIEEGTS